MAETPLNEPTPDSVPLTVNQEAMWVGWQVAPTAPTHVLPFAFRVTGELATARLRQTVAALGTRHPTLRGRVVASTAGARLTWRDAPPIPVTERAVTGRVEQAVLDTAHSVPFDLDHGPLARVEVLRGPDYTVLLIAVHHIVFDGTSVVPFLLDLRRAYAGEELDAADSLTPLRTMARRGRELSDGPEGADHRAFWQGLLAEPIGHQTLPCRQTAPDEFRLWKFGIDPETEARVRDLARETGTSYFTVMFAAFFLMLRHHMGHDDPVVAAPHHGRTDPALKDRVGYFVNVLPFRPRPKGSHTYRAYLGHFRDHARQVLAHHALPLPALLRAASLTGPEAHKRTHETVFQYWNPTIDDRLDVRDIELPGPDGTCRLELIDVLDVADYALTVMLREDTTGSSMVWKDPNNRFGDEMLRRLSEDYLTVLRDMVERPDGTVADGTACLSPSLALSEPPSAHTEIPMPSEATPEAEPDVDPEILSAVADVWRDVLGLPSVAAADSFFELGGHSLLAATLIDRIARRLNADLALADLFGHPRLGDLAAIVQRRLSERGEKTAAPAHRTGPVPASPFQEGIWLAQRMDPDHARYHIPLSWAVDGPVDIPALRAALTRLVARHELLRTAFVEQDGRPHLVVMPPWTPDLDEIDVQDADDTESDRAVAAWGEAAAHTFSLTRGRLLRAALHKGRGGRTTLSLCVHHLVLDGGSVPVLLRELRKCYRAVTGTASALPALRRQYGDLIARWAEHRTEGLEFWRRRLDGAPSTLKLRAPQQPEPHGQFTLPLPADLTTRLAPVRAEHQVSDFMITACAVAGALHRQTGLQDVTLGFPVAITRPPAFRDLIGPSMNTVLLRTHCTPLTTVAELLRQVRDETVAAMTHQDVPFENVVRQMRPPRLPGRTPYLDVLVNSVDQSGWSLDLGEARLTPLTIGGRIDADSKVPVTVTTTVSADGTLRASLAYRGDQVERAAAAGLAMQVTSLLSDQFSADPKGSSRVLREPRIEVTA
ncbi:condensation domain-containing protein [Streptomyces sp. L2]|uniref:condensation domain-containing protein n=1 Tax=Streptomyces sp. L2 TaxID=2162665 RepID=UPI00101149D0|nr:condensation domain-containing protein [Streptomyces sp. L2]